MQVLPHDGQDGSHAVQPDPEPLRRLGRREGLREQPADRRPMDIVPGRGRQRRVDQRHRRRRAPPARRLVQPVAGHRLDQPVHRQAVGLDADQREAAERLDRAVAVERVAQPFRQRLGLGAEQVARDGVRGRGTPGAASARAAAGQSWAAWSSDACQAWATASG